MPDTQTIFLSKLPWWKRTWGIALIIIGTCVGGFGVYVGYLTYDNVQLFRHGVLETVSSNTNKFTADKKGGGQVSGSTKPLTLPTSARFGDLSANPKLTVVEFVDFQCPYSKEEFSIFRSLMTRVIPGLQFVVRDFPLTDIHPYAVRAAEASRCAGDQDKYWAYHDQLYLNQNDFTDPSLLKYAAQAGLDGEKFKKCLTSGDHHKEVMQDLQDGMALGVQGTPTFFLNGIKIEGVVPIDVWQKIFEKFDV